MAADASLAREAPEEFFLDSTFDRLWRGFMTARVTIGLVLLLLLGTVYTLAAPPSVERWLVGLCATYTMAAVSVRLFTRPLPPGDRFDPHWVFTIGVDIVMFAALQFLQAAGINYAPLFALPVLMASVLGSALLALGTAAGVALLLLVDAWVQALENPAEMASRFLQAGLTGTGYFAVAIMVNQLAGRLAREEAAARSGRRAARIQAQVNEVVIEALSEGVLVVDGRGHVHAANPAARQLLGLPAQGSLSSLSLASQEPWAPMQRLAAETFLKGGGQVGEVAFLEQGAGPRRVHVRTRLTDTGELQEGGGLCVMFLQDLREMEARLRTEKLAAMGRMSAAVAHEIRNPLAAIAQANELMEEDLRDPGLRQLSGLVRKNAQRLAQIVEEILDISRARGGTAGASPALELDAAVAAACADWTQQAGCAARVHVAPGAPGHRVFFAPDHLRRILVNLLDNALRYAGDRPDSIRVSTRLAGGRASLSVWSDGAPLEASVQRHLFEPFFSSESRSSGLGLFICRELCERHGATMTYERKASGEGAGPREGNEFVVLFSPRAVSAVASAGAFDTIGA